jgi:glutathione S-transferase
MTLDYVDLETAKAARGTRLVTTSLVPSPWSEAATGCLRIANVPALVVRRGLDKTAVDAWTGTDNVPVLFHDREPIRTTWSAIVTFVDRMARVGGTPRLLPDDVAARARVMGVLHEIAGEEGIGWNARLAMIEAGLTSAGARGFPPPVATFLARRYGHTAAAAADAPARMRAGLGYLEATLAAAGGRYFGGDAPGAIDVYAATFLTPVVAPISEAECPDLLPPLRIAFASASEAFGALVPPALVAHRARMFDTHLERPIRL